MITLLPNTENLVILSLSEKVTIATPTYLMRFVHTESRTEYSCIITPVDEYEFGRESFIIETKTSGANNLLGEIVLTLGDQYQYFVYAQSSTTNLDYTLADEELESGIMKYNKTITERNVYERGATSRKVYTRS